MTQFKKEPTINPKKNQNKQKIILIITYFIKSRKFGKINWLFQEKRPAFKAGR